MEANYWQTRSIARPLCDSRATCYRPNCVDFVLLYVCLIQLSIQAAILLNKCVCIIFGNERKNKQLHKRRGLLIFIDFRQQHHANWFMLFNPLMGTLKPQSNGQYGDCYTGRWWLVCYVLYSNEGPGRAKAPPSPLIAVPNVTAHPSTASVPTSYYSIWHYNYRAH